MQASPRTRGCDCAVTVDDSTSVASYVFNGVPVARSAVATSAASVGSGSATGWLEHDGEVRVAVAPGRRALTSVPGFAQPNTPRRRVGEGAAATSRSAEAAEFAAAAATSVERRGKHGRDGHGAPTWARATKRTRYGSPGSGRSTPQAAPPTLVHCYSRRQARPLHVNWSDSGDTGMSHEGFVTRFTNCRLVRGGKLVRDDLWVSDGRIIDPARRFWEASSTRVRCCKRGVPGAPCDTLLTHAHVVPCASHHVPAVLLRSLLRIGSSIALAASSRRA